MNWMQESCDLYDDPESGARIIQLTSGATISNNIYGEQPYCSPDGSRLAIARSRDFHFDPTGLFLVFDLTKLRIGLVEKIQGVRGISTNAWSGKLYYWSLQNELKRMDLTTLSREIVYVPNNAEDTGILGSVSPDQRYMLGFGRRLQGPGAPTFQILRLDLETGEKMVILEHPEICNPHLQFNPITGDDILVQNNRGVFLEPDGTLDYRHSEAGTSLFLIDKDGKNLRQLPVGPPFTATSTGHECFIPGTDRVLFSSQWNHESWQFDSRFPGGNIFTVAPGDAAPTVFVCPEHRFNHVSVSHCGTYFVADSHGDKGLFINGALGPISLVIGNLKTGKYRTLVKDSMAISGGNQSTHTHPYLTTDNRHVIYNANPFHSTPQVYAARIPEDFLPSLD